MRTLQLHPGDAASIDIDANQMDQSPVSLNDGPVESVLWSEQLGWLPTGTRLYGRIWTGGPSVVVRYYSAQPPDNEPIPICAVARKAKGQMMKLPGSKPGNALILDSRVLLVIVNEFR